MSGGRSSEQPPIDFDAAATEPIRQELLGRAIAVELVVVEGPDAGQRLRVPPGTARIGTARAAHLRLADRSVSRLHCEITVGPESVVLRDLGSTNGTFVDGRRVRDVDVGSGTHIRIGTTSIQVVFGGAAIPIALSERTSFGALVGRSPEMRRVYTVLERAAATDTTVLVLGETGTGKELVARALHDASPRAAGPFVTVDCGAIPEQLMESELFGHVRGAFTGAVMDRRGAFEEANGGTIFFDEVGELPYALQSKLLRALESRTFRRVGTTNYRPCDVRVVAATHRSLARGVNDATFREDLYYRLAVIEIEIPPLRARRDDIPVLAAHLLQRFTGRAVSPPPETLAALATRDWPGNVRELRNFIERSVSLGWAELTAPLGAPAGPASTPGRTIPGGAVALPPELASLAELPRKAAREAWQEYFDRFYTRAVLDRAEGNVTRAAELAEVNRRFLQRTMVRLGLRASDPDALEHGSEQDEADEDDLP